MTSALAYIVLGLFALWALTLLALALGFALMDTRGEVADGRDYYDTDVSPQMRQARAALSGGDDWMDIADVVSDDHHPDDCDCTDISLEGVTDGDAGVLRRNWMALTDDERHELNEAFDAIVEGADR